MKKLKLGGHVLETMIGNRSVGTGTATLTSTISLEPVWIKSIKHAAKTMERIYFNLKLHNNKNIRESSFPALFRATELRAAQHAGRRLIPDFRSVLLSAAVSVDSYVRCAGKHTCGHFDW